MPGIRARALLQVRPALIIAIIWPWAEQGPLNCLEADGADIKLRTGTIGVGIGGLGYIESMAKALAEKGPQSDLVLLHTGHHLQPRARPYFYEQRLKGVKPTRPRALVRRELPHRRSLLHTIARGEIDACVAEVPPTHPARRGGACNARREQAQRPTREGGKGRDGFGHCRGAGLVFLEEREHAIQRGAQHPNASIVGDRPRPTPIHLTQPAPRG